MLHKNKGRNPGTVTADTFRATFLFTENSKYTPYFPGNPSQYIANLRWRCTGIGRSKRNSGLQCPSFFHKISCSFQIFTSILILFYFLIIIHYNTGTWQFKDLENFIILLAFLRYFNHHQIGSGFACLYCWENMLFCLWLLTRQHKEYFFGWQIEYLK